VVVKPQDAPVGTEMGHECNLTPPCA
jgi:hypothetical protein